MGQNKPAEQSEGEENKMMGLLQGLTLLMVAAMTGDLNTLNDLVEQGSVLDEPDSDGMTALMHAANQNQIDSVFRLVELGSSISLKNANQMTSFNIAHANGFKEMEPPLAGGIPWINAEKARQKLMDQFGLGVTERVMALSNNEEPLQLSKRHSLYIVIEHCNAERPSFSLRGDLSKYTDTYGELASQCESAFEPWKHEEAVIEVLANSKPHKDCFQNGLEGISFTSQPPLVSPPNSRPGSAGSTMSALSGMSGKSAKTRMMEKMYPWGENYPDTPRDGLFCDMKVIEPRIGAFEVAYMLYEDGRLLSERLLASKLATRKWPKTEFVAKTLFLAVQQDLQQAKVFYYN